MLSMLSIMSGCTHIGITEKRSIAVFGVLKVSMDSNPRFPTGEKEKR
jgi:hypothetical protein